MSGIKIIYGAASFRPDNGVANADDIEPYFAALEKGGITTIDTAALYGPSEGLLGGAGAGKRFTVDTKARGGATPGGASRDSILGDFRNSQEALQTTVDVFYIHAPDTANTPLEESLAAINEVYQTGFFKRFGLSNFSASEVQQAYDICKAKGYPLPTVYQGNYSAAARKQEAVLFPTLRKLGISFYAYSPMAGGFLTKTKQQVLDGHGRFDTSKPIGQMYSALYNKPALLEALAEWEAIAKEEGITKADLANRWVRFNSALKPEHGDGIIIGTSSVSQLQETIDSINAGPLSARAAARIDAMWEMIKDESPLDNFAAGGLPQGIVKDLKHDK